MRLCGTRILRGKSARSLSSLEGRAIFCAMKPMTYCIYREAEFFVAQCLNVNVSSFGATRDEAIANLKEAVELYFDGETVGGFTDVSEASVGQELVNA